MGFMVAIAFWLLGMVIYGNATSTVQQSGFALGSLLTISAPNKLLLFFLTIVMQIFSTRPSKCDGPKYEQAAFPSLNAVHRFLMLLQPPLFIHKK